jgi:hypothetical protein
MWTHRERASFRPRVVKSNDLKKARVQGALLKTDGNPEQAANLPGITLSHLNRLIRTLGL